ncbi:hypothetical protein AVEN_267612-1 [Araneus ventricosus]|uniref:Uncharacterized protein n=1 Tax=Araneus ventricosus TaxID=182803 RepID=A0A4Y2PVT8_ARAVE|nr:hypothetical protein AVEN_267612-1 [Araneus ventricosus]
MLSLQNMTVIKIITTMCNNQQLQSLIIDSHEGFENRMYSKTGRKFKAVQDLANELISKMCNCTRFKELILELLWPVSYRIMFWISVYAPFIKPTTFYWTDRGRIDNVATAKYILRNEKVSVRERFKLACKLCLSTEIREIWSEMTDEDRTYFQYRKRETFRPLLLFWVYTMKGSDYIRELYMPDIFECATKFGLLEAIKYFFSIMPDHLKNDMAALGEDHLHKKADTTCFLEEDEVDIGYLLFSQLWDSNKLISFHFDSASTLSLILHSSEHKFFLEELAQRLPFMSTASTESLLYLLFYSYHSEMKVMKDRDYCKLFMDVWRTVPASVRNSLIAKPNFGRHFLKVMIKREFRYLLREASNNIDEYAASTLAPNTSVTPHCFDESDWEFLNFLIEEGIATIPSLTKSRSVLLNFLEGKGIQRLLEKSLNICN